MLTGSQEAGMFCFFAAVALAAVGYGIWKKKKTDWIPGYKKKAGENTAAYCTLAGKGVILMGAGMFILSVPISLVEPDKIFALCCLVCCFVFIGMGVSLFLRAEKKYH